MTKTIMLFVSMFFVVAFNASAASLQDLQVKDLDKIAVSEKKVISDETLMTIGYVGASTEAAVVINSPTVGTEAPIGTADLSYNWTAAAYDTLGELCDAIDAEADYTCKLTGGKRDDASTLLGTVAASSSTDAKAAGGYGVLISGVPTSKTDPYIMTLGITPSTGKRVVLKYCIGNINVIDAIKVYGKLAKFEGANDGVTRNDTTEVYSAITADDTDKTIGNVYGVPWLEFAKDAHVVIRSSDADNAQAAANYIECSWDEK